MPNLTAAGWLLVAFVLAVLLYLVWRWPSREKNQVRHGSSSGLRQTLKYLESVPEVAPISQGIDSSPPEYYELKRGYDLFELYFQSDRDGHVQMQMRVLSEEHEPLSIVAVNCVATEVIFDKRAVSVVDLEDWERQVVEALVGKVCTFLDTEQRMSMPG